MILVKLIGRFGNNLFQLAAAEALAYKLKSLWAIHNLEEKDHLGNFSLNLIKRAYFNYQAKNMMEIYDEDKHLSCINSNIATPKHIFLKGYFQSEKFFNCIKDKLVSKYRKKYLNTVNNSIVSDNIIHVRGGDYLKLQNFSLNQPFYYNAIDILGERKWTVVTDDVTYAKSIFKNLNIKQYITQNMMQDFQTLSMAHNLIISNSTFAWWGAYLNQNTNVKVCAPKYWLGQLDKIQKPADIIPQHWIQIDH